MATPTYTPFYDALDEVDQCNHSDGEHILMNIRDNSPAGYGWHWVPVETVAEYGRTDILEAFGVIYLTIPYPGASPMTRPQNSAAKS